MKYGGILRIGFKLLVNDKAKFSALLIGITFAVFLMVQMTSMFAGILNRAYSTVNNIGATLWIMDHGSCGEYCHQFDPSAGLSAGCGELNDHRGMIVDMGWVLDSSR